MNRENYRKAFDELSFSADFQERTAALLQTHARELEKEKPMRRFKRTKKMAVLVAAAVALLAVSVSAAVLWLSPSQVAEKLSDPLLAQAFDSEDAVILNETVQSGDYTITLGGLVSGKGISRWCADADGSRTYAVAAVARTDGTPLTDENFEILGGGGTFAISPLVAGYAPQAVNSWTLGGGCSSFLENGVAYYVLDTGDFQMFADHTVYLAVYEGFVPSYDTFSAAEDGTYSIRAGVTGALFTLPLDERLADPAAAQAFVEATGINYLPMTDEERATAETEETLPTVTETENGDGSKSITIENGSYGAGIQTGQRIGKDAFLTPEEFEAYLTQERERLQQQVRMGVLSQENFDKTVAELEETLAGLEDGTLVAFLDGGDTLVTGTASNSGYDFQYSKTEDGAVGITITDAK